jgi:hypothetical protein
MSVIKFIDIKFILPFVIKISVCYYTFGVVFLCFLCYLIRFSPCCMCQVLLCMLLIYSLTIITICLSYHKIVNTVLYFDKLEEERVPVPFCLLQIPHGLVWTNPGLRSVRLAPNRLSHGSA